jgi:hypothetical protein
MSRAFNEVELRAIARLRWDGLDMEAKDILGSVDPRTHINLSRLWHACWSYQRGMPLEQAVQEYLRGFY